jgi:transcription elongation factor Elf1
MDIPIVLAIKSRIVDVLPMNGNPCTSSINADNADPTIKGRMNFRKAKKDMKPKGTKNKIFNCPECEVNILSKPSKVTLKVSV